MNKAYTLIHLCILLTLYVTMKKIFKEIVSLLLCVLNVDDSQIPGNISAIKLSWSGDNLTIEWNSNLIMTSFDVVIDTNYSVIWNLTTFEPTITLNISDEAFLSISITPLCVSRPYQFVIGKTELIPLTKIKFIQFILDSWFFSPLVRNILNNNCYLYLHISNTWELGYSDAIENVSCAQNDTLHNNILYPFKSNQSATTLQNNTSLITSPPTITISDRTSEKHVLNYVLSNNTILLISIIPGGLIFIILVLSVLIFIILSKF